MTTKKQLKELLEESIEIVGLQPLAEGLGVTYQAIRKWQKTNRMPDTEYSGRTSHSLKIQELTNGKVTVLMLLGCIPPHIETAA